MTPLYALTWLYSDGRRDASCAPGWTLAEIIKVAVPRLNQVPSLRAELVDLSDPDRRLCVIRGRAKAPEPGASSLILED